MRSRRTHKRTRKKYKKDIGRNKIRSRNVFMRGGATEPTSPPVKGAAIPGIGELTVEPTVKPTVKPTVEPTVEPTIDERGERVKRRAQDPKQSIMDYFKTADFQPAIEQHNEFIRHMCNNPYETYIMFKSRLEKEGGGASFPELGGCVKFLIKALFQGKIHDWFVQSGNTILIEQVTHKILGLMIEDRFDFPYVDTIYVIENLLELIDFYWRRTQTQNEELPINERIGPYYHVFRYRSYISTFLHSEHGIPNNIIFPTCANIGATHLIKIRCVPILLMGVVDEPVYVDQYMNTPLDFWAHDIQHSKRQIQETLRYYDVFIKHTNYYKRRTLYDLKTTDEFYQYMHQFTKSKILPMITLARHPKDGTETREKERAYRAIKKLIIFEVVHEKAWPITQPSLCRNISLRYDEFPVENITLGEDKVIKAFHYLFADPTTIGNVVGKLRTGFYDKTSDPQEYVVDKEYRKSSHVATCAKEIMETLGCSKTPSTEYFLALATDRHAMQEFEDIPKIEGDDEPIGTVNYPEDGPTMNYYSDLDLYTTFDPVIKDITDVASQDSLHKKTVVEGYDENTFEKDV